MTYYPDQYHPVYFLIDALRSQGATADFARDERTENCWGAIVNGKSVVWLIDNRHPHEAEHEDPAAKRLLERGALVCHAQKPDAERVGGKWLPLAVSPGFRFPDQQPPKAFDVAFVGYVRDIVRAQILTDVAALFRLSVGQGIFGEDAVRTYWSATVGLNIPTGWGAPDSFDTANMRCFEVLATGTPLLTAHEDYLPELGIENGVNCLTYRTALELLEQIRRLVDNPELAQQLGLNGAELALARHTYQHRAKQVLEWLT